MTHSPIRFDRLTLSFPHKTCFEDVNLHIHSGSRIGIIGRNGAGKSTLLRIILGDCSPTCGEVYIPPDAVIACVPQIVEDFEQCSGGQRFNKALTQALVNDPNVLLLDEPTNHLDSRNRASLMKMLELFRGTLIVSTHDTALLRYMDTLWHLDEGKLKVFPGNYDDYMRERRSKRESIEQELLRLDRQKRDTHQALMKEQERAKKSNERGEKSIQNRKWPTIVSDEKARRAIETSGKKKRILRGEREELVEKLSALRLPPVIVPKFSLAAADLGERTLIAVSDGSVGYKGKPMILSDLHLSVGAHDRVVIQGNNGSGKTTLVRALRGDSLVVRQGQWYVPPPQDIGYLDQHYSTLDSGRSVFETIAHIAPDWDRGKIRQHLNDFLFRKNEEVNAKVSVLSGGEKARLSLAQIAAHTPKLLILDEVTNNLDLETREHIIQVLKQYPGAMIVISHDADFIDHLCEEGIIYVRF